MKHLLVIAVIVFTTLSGGASFAFGALNTIEFIVLDKSTGKPIGFSVDMSQVPKKTPFFAELSLNGPSRLTWAGSPDMPISIDAEGYNSYKLNKGSIRSITQVTTAPRSLYVVSLLLIRNKL